MLLERTLVIAKLLVIATAVVVAILCLSFDNAYGLVVPQMRLQNPGEQPQLSSGSGTTTATQFEIAEQLFDQNIDGGEYDQGGDNDRCPPIPEPTTLILLGAGLAGIKLLKRRS